MSIAAHAKLAFESLAIELVGFCWTRVSMCIVWPTSVTGCGAMSSVEGSSHSSGTWRCVTRRQWAHSGLVVW